MFQRLGDSVGRTRLLSVARGAQVLTLITLFGLTVPPCGALENFEFWPGTAYDPEVPSFEEVLGHAPGEQIVSHREMMDYLEALSQARSDRIKVFEYARSWEGRELVYAVLGSAANLARLDEIRRGMQALADPRELDDEAAQRLVEELPAITWLAYGVHGNEISSPDAALLVAYHLVAARQDEVVDSILRDSLVILDPTQNPDGRDRFVHHFRIASGLVADPHPLAAEHNEPWPGGRTNHYYFDLNRDWLALTQPETRGRVRALQEWFPQVFVDLHEMGSNSTYYFAPEAVPYNPHITAQQRATLELYGRNNARWFDHYGFDYFTREVYDAFYPGYGASWPLYHGAIAMTYEQATASGLVYRRTDAVDMTFRDTVRQHFVASISTAETTARHRHKLLQDFYRYRQSAVEEGRREEVRQYVLPNRGDTSAVARLAGLLAEHGVEVERFDAPYRACNAEYPAGSYAVSLAQPTKRLIRTFLDLEVPMEEAFLAEQERRRQRRLPDEIYDVTAWSLPLMFNVECVPCDEAVTGRGERVKPGQSLVGRLDNEGAEVAYLVPWGSAAAGRLAAAALRDGLRVFTTDKALTQNGRTYPAGTLIFKVDDNPRDLAPRLASLAQRTGAHVYGTDTGWVEAGINFGSRHVHHLRAPRIALAWDRPTLAYSAGATRFVLERQFGYPVTPIRCRQLMGGDLASFDVLILPEGNYSRIFDDATHERLRRWVEEGGTLVGIGSALAYLSEANLKEDNLKEDRAGLLAIRREAKETEGEPEAAKPDAKKTTLLANESDYLKAIEPASETPDSLSGVLARARVDTRHWLGAGLGPVVYALVRGRDIYSPMTLDRGTNVVVLAGPEELLASGYIWEENRRQLAYKPLVVSQTHGRGLVVGFVADPNFRAYMDGLNVLFLNAVFRGPARARPAVPR